MEITIVQPTDQLALYDLFRRMFTDAPEASLKDWPTISRRYAAASKS